MTSFKKLLLMKEFMNYIPDELKVYLNERTLVTSYEMVATADEYIITHKKERRGDLMGASQYQVWTKPTQRDTRG